MARKSFRQRFVFWLDIEKDHEADIAEAIDSLKQKRSFSKTIRDGIRLIVDLRAGRTDVLFELFPLLRAKLQADFGGNTDDGLTEEKIRAIFQEATSNLSAPALTADVPLSRGNHQSHKPPAPDFDELDLTSFAKTFVKDRKGDEDGGKQASRNFLDMIGNIQTGKGGW